MEHIRLIQMGTEHNTLLSNLATILSSIQDFYYFIFEEDVIKLPNQAKDCHVTQELEDMARSYMTQHRYTEYPIVVTGVRLQDDLASTTDSQLALISTHDWSTFSSYPVIIGLQYMVAGALLDRLEIGSVHYDTKGCPNDYCDKRSDIDIGIRNGEFCNLCRGAILQALEKQTLTLQHVIGIYRILDQVANRRICFILMPFRQKFDGPYQILKTLLEDMGLQPVRADEIFESRSIIQIISEMIGRAEFIIADLTDRNPNVFYELGYAHGLGKSTILVTQSDDDVPFDLRYRKYILYDPATAEITLGKPVLSYFPVAMSSQKLSGIK